MGLEFPTPWAGPGSASHRARPVGANNDSPSHSVVISAATIM